MLVKLAARCIETLAYKQLLYEAIILHYCPHTVPSLDINIKAHHQRSYIDIDASDPFKVPKTSEYVDQPVPDYDESVKRKHDEESGSREDGASSSQHHSAEHMGMAPERRRHWNSGYNDNHEEYNDANSHFDEPSASHFDGPQVPASEEESPRGVDPGPPPGSYDSHDDDEHFRDGNNEHFRENSDHFHDSVERFREGNERFREGNEHHDEEEHTMGDSRHNVPKGELNSDESSSDPHRERDRGGEGPYDEQGGSRREGSEKPFNGYGDKDRDDDIEKKGERYRSGENEHGWDGNRSPDEGAARGPQGNSWHDEREHEATGHSDQDYGEGEKNFHEGGYNNEE
eukprot:gene17973-19769_t